MTIDQDRKRFEAARERQARARGEAAEVAQRSIARYLEELLRPLIGAAVKLAWTFVTDLFTKLFRRPAAR